MTAAGRPPSAPIRRRIALDGPVQGVGLRPFVHREAVRRGLAGFVRNDAAGALVEAEGAEAQIAAFLAALAARGAPGAGARRRIEALPCEGTLGFAILPSDAAGAPTAAIPPDAATCADCLRELFDPADRRYRHPFVTCARCGPRYSILEALPFDRARTAMRAFPLCVACRREFDNPADRRFHAQTVACPACGPRLALLDRAGREIAREAAALARAVAAVQAGRIVALKGLGGFQLVLDARNETAIAALRARKRRPRKPLAVMFADLAAVDAACVASEAERALLASPAAPIVLLRRRAEAALAPGIAPGNPLLGAMLPTTPLHHLLLADIGGPIVATSGNLSGAPLAADTEEALAALGSIADLFLVHDRPIRHPVDDSVVRVVAGRPLLLRRARGYAPLPVPLPPARSAEAGTVLAFGAHQRATAALALADRAVPGPYLGDLEDARARDRHAAAAAALPALHGARPATVVHDLHPDYASTALARGLGLPAFGVQHHLAHAAAVLAEHGRGLPALGVVWDGTGHGTDGTMWGGELLRLEARGAWRRLAGLRPFPLPGAAAAVRESRRAALGLLFAALGPAALERTDLAPVAAFTPAERALLGRQLATGLNAPRSSSIGRLFDAVAALLGLCQRASHEAEAAMAVEFAALAATPHETAEAAPYCLGLAPDADGLLRLDWAPLLAALLTDLAAGRAVPGIAARFHAALVDAIAAMVRQSGGGTVVLAGGCFQNALLLEGAIVALREAGAEPLWPAALPANDEAIAVGQLAWVRLSGQAREGEPCA